MPPIIREGRVRLASGHSLIIGHGPLLSKVEFTESAFKERIESFGLFNLATPDTSSYYPDVTAEDLAPKPEDYVLPIFRALSEVIVRKHTDPIDFGHEKGVLKASMNKLLGQSIYSNHEAFVGNEKGVVSRVMWQEGYKAGDLYVPAGFNFEAKIDGKNHPRLARDLMSEPPVVHSNSVTVQFKWAQSHTKMSFDEFRGKVGTFDKEGKLIRRIAVEIDAYHETSFVSHGADPYAQKLDKDGKIINPAYAVQRDSFSEAKKTSSFFAFDWKDSLSEVTIPKDVITTENGDTPDKTKPRRKMKKELALLLVGLSAVSIPADQLKLEGEAFEEAFDEDSFADAILAKSDEINGLTALSTKVEELEGEVETLTADKLELEKFKTENEPKLTQLTELEAVKASLLGDVLKDAALVTGKAVDASLKATFEAADVKTLKVFKQSYAAQLDAKFPMECKSCGGHEVTRASVEITEDDPADKDKNKTKALSFEQIRENARNGSPSKPAWL